MSFSLRSKSTEQGLLKIPPGRIDSLQGIRGAAVLLVVTSHVMTSGDTSIALGVMGVTMFFTLSGFLITGLLTTSSSEGLRHLDGFYGARAVRLLPALLVLILVVGSVWILGGRPIAAFAEYGATALFYVENFFSARHDQQVLAHTWSLAVEEQFYLLWPLLLVLLLRVRVRTRLAVLSALVLGSIVLRFVLFRLGDGHFAYSGLPSNAYALLLGAAPRLLPFRGAPSAWVTRAAMAALMVLALIGGRLPAATVLTPALTAALTITVISGSLHGNGLLARRPLVFVGGISYAWYLWHWPVLWLAGTLHSGLHALPAVGASLIAACSSTFLIENPLRKRYRSFYDRRGARTAASSP